MATTKTKTPAKKKSPAKKAPASKKAASRKKAPASAARESTEGAIDVLTLDASHDADVPDASPLSLAAHGESLAATVRSLHAALSKAKVRAADATRLDGLATLLRARETAWQSARRATATGTVASCREPLLTGRNDLFGAVDAFVDDEAAAKELEEIGTVDDDNDLEDDTRRLLALARKHADALDGTEITPAKVDEVEAALVAFRSARKGAVTSERAEGASKQELGEAARVALELRNRAFWALSALDRLVCKRGRFRFRADAKRKALFNAYVTEAKRGRKAKAPKTPATPKTP